MTTELETKLDRATAKPGVLEKWGVLSSLKAACLTLVSTDPEMIRSMMLSIPCVGEDGEADWAIERVAEEHCLEADVERTGGTLVIRLKRQIGDAK